MPSTTESRPPQDWPVVWFAELERAIEPGDFVAAARAQQELARLGVVVRWPMPRAGEAVQHE